MLVRSSGPSRSMSNGTAPRVGRPELDGSPAAPQLQRDGSPEDSASMKPILSIPRRPSSVRTGMTSPV
jgi:hypothetical protein